MLEERLDDYNLAFKVVSLIRNLKSSSDLRYEEISRIMANIQERHEKQGAQLSFDAILEGSKAVFNYLEGKYDDLYAKIQKHLIGQTC